MAKHPLIKPIEDEEDKDFIKIRESFIEFESDLERAGTPSMAMDLFRSSMILEKVTDTESNYAHHLYCSMCNNVFQKLDTESILFDKVWHTSWRNAAKIVATLRGGDSCYTDFYLSNLVADYTDESVTEGRITAEVLTDLKNIGWTVASDKLVSSTRR